MGTDTTSNKHWHTRTHGLHAAAALKTLPGTARTALPWAAFMTFSLGGLAEQPLDMALCGQDGRTAMQAATRTAVPRSCLPRLSWGSYRALRTLLARLPQPPYNIRILPSATPVWDRYYNATPV